MGLNLAWCIQRKEELSTLYYSVRYLAADSGCCPLFAECWTFEILNCRTTDLGYWTPGAFTLNSAWTTRHLNQPRVVRGELLRGRVVAYPYHPAGNSSLHGELHSCLTEWARTAPSQLLGALQHHSLTTGIQHSTKRPASRVGSSISPQCYPVRVHSATSCNTLKRLLGFRQFTT